MHEIDSHFYASAQNLSPQPAAYVVTAPPKPANQTLFQSPVQPSVTKGGAESLPAVQSR
ncbi:hypothetical protein [Croceicoccus sp. Ery15]|uniref:hypothetical protein n=1 Tax=Croceicoccus sp. Ery15 TaxID=1703338 RepID=UPI001E2BE5D8|nr:hypothetical protein [Croceicoccus sp. Ery15]